MARIRTIKHEFWTSKTLARVSRDSRLTFIGLWSLADDLGVLLDLPRKIAADLYPHEDVSIKDINRWLDDLVSVGLIVRVSEKSKDFIIIRSWDEHQKIDHPSKNTHLSRESRDSLASVSRLDMDKDLDMDMDMDMEGGCKGGTISEPRETTEAPKAARASRSLDYSPEFEEFWTQYPKRHGADSKQAGWRCWQARVKDGCGPGTMILGAQRYAAYCDAKAITGTEYVMQASRFLGRDRHFENDWRKPNASGYVFDPNDRPF